MKYFYYDADTQDGTPADETIDGSAGEIVAQWKVLSRQAGSFLGMYCPSGVILQFRWDDSDSVYIDIPLPERSGSLAKQSSFEQCQAAIVDTCSGRDPTAMAGLQFEPWQVENSTELDEDTLESIKTCVWSGFYDASAMQGVIDDMLEEGADEEMLQEAVRVEFAKKAAAEATWPAVTDCDRLDRAFEQMEANGLIALQYAGYTQSDGLDDVGQALHERGHDNVKGYCFYHGQDVARAMAGDGLFLAYGDLESDPDQRAAVGHVVVHALESNGLAVEWNGDQETRIRLPRIDWKRRGPESGL